MVNSKSIPKIIQFGVDDDKINTEQDMKQIRQLFIDGMRQNNFPEKLIQESLQSDLKDAGSLRETYFVGNGTFLMLVDDGDSEIGGATASTKSELGKGSIWKTGNQSRIIGIVGLQDMGSASSKRKKVCELRRMSIHSSCQRLGYGASLVRECISYAKRYFDCIFVHTGEWMEAALRFYIKIGFEYMGRIVYKDDDDGIAATFAHLELIL